MKIINVSHIAIYLCLAAFVITASSCKKDLNGFRLTYYTNFKILAGVSVFETQYIDLPTINSEFEFYTQQHGYNVSDLKKIYPNVARLRAYPQSYNLGFIEWMKIYIIPQDPATAPILIFDKVNNQTIKSDNFELLPWEANYLDDFKSGKFKIRLQLKYENTPLSFIDCSLDLLFQAE